MVPLETDVVDINVPLLIGLDFLDEHKMYVNNTTDMLECVNKGIQVPLVRKLGHLFFEWEANILYTFFGAAAIPQAFLPRQLRATVRAHAAGQGVRRRAADIEAATRCSGRL